MRSKGWDLNEIKGIFVSDYDIYEFKNSYEPILTFRMSNINEET